MLQTVFCFIFTGAKVTINWSIVTDLFFGIVMYIWVKQIIEKEEKCKVQIWFYASVVFEMAEF